MYARQRERMTKRNGNKKPDASQINEYITKALVEIDDAQTDGQYGESLRKAKKCMSTVENYTEDEIKNKLEIIASLQSSMGNAYLELGDIDKSLSHHQNDLDISTDIDHEEGKSRALDNLGRTYARKGQFQKAIDVWTSKINITKSELENTWLFHEIGRCHLELGNYAEAKNYGEKALASAESASDDMWQLNASVLVAQTEVKLKEYQSALSSFEKVLDMAKAQGDESAEAAIKKAIEDVNQKIVDNMKDEEIAPEESREQTPPPREPTPPPREPTPPPREPTPPPKEPTPPPREPTPPPREPTPPPREATPPPREDSPPPREDSPPPKEITPPSTPSKDSSLVDDQSSTTKADTSTTA